MEGRKPPEFGIELSADRQNVKEVVKGIMHTIFFHRLFTPLEPANYDVLDVTVPYVDDKELIQLLETRSTTLLRALDSGSTTLSPQYNPKSSGAARSTLVIQFLERKRRKGWFISKADEETIWESWILEVNLTSARSEPEAEWNRRVMENSLQDAVMKVITTANKEKNHIPPITTNDSNAFPYQILVNPKA
ncbi:hypothetical protein LTR78_003594 [Recurvomyces mirabilis]|uniref:Autophagy-related protein 101 n=1 Tax=Recurvomyces mirabilis TaxID=574656 RepID=A0AAE1C375_9PEZI|nr:hypothetical protein LTR78_003594 [Recurvomyces mirabilis]KAK5154709.1 hypothetical protein LTS14_006288 [Recurvomyces mirabilis]